MSSPAALPKNKMLMQIYADVTGLPLTVVAASRGRRWAVPCTPPSPPGAYPDIRAAAARMGRAEREMSYNPIPRPARSTTRSIADYSTLHDYFGRGANDVMKRV